MTIQPNLVASTKSHRALAVKFQPVDDLVDHLALGAHGYSDQIELGAEHRPTASRLAASCVVLNMSSV
jgi:hypothetical protein